MSMQTLRITTACLTISALTGLAHVQAQQIGNIQSNQSDRSATDAQDQQQDQQQDRYEARRASIDTQSKGVPLQQVMIKKMRLSNDAGIELAKMAQDKSNNEQVKQLAKTIIDDHQGLNEKLQKLTSDGKSTTDQAESNQDRAGANRNRLTRQRDQGTAQQGTTQQGTTQQGTTQQGTTQQGTAQQGSAAKLSDRLERDGQASEMDRSQAGANRVPNELCQVLDQTSQNALNMTKDMLKKYDGKEFEMAYVGHQLVAHTMLLAELKAIESVGPQNLQPIAKESISKVEQHIEQAKKVAKELKSDKNRDQSDF